jgi:hypothetical protein
MAKLWYPDTCRNGQCILEIVDGHQGLTSVVQTCAHHNNMRGGLGSDNELFDRVLGTNRVKNKATIDAAAELALELAEVPWSVNDQDQIVIVTGLNATRRARLQTAVDNRVGPDLVVIA